MSRLSSIDGDSTSAAEMRMISRPFACSSYIVSLGKIIYSPKAINLKFMPASSNVIPYSSECQPCTDNYLLYHL
jgi:hypothetical protein